MNLVVDEGFESACEEAKHIANVETANGAIKQSASTTGRFISMRFLPGDRENLDGGQCELEHTDTQCAVQHSDVSSRDLVTEIFQVQFYSYEFHI